MKRAKEHKDDPIKWLLTGLYARDLEWNFIREMSVPRAILDAKSFFALLKNLTTDPAYNSWWNFLSAFCGPKANKTTNRILFDELSSEKTKS